MVMMRYQNNNVDLATNELSYDMSCPKAGAVKLEPDASLAELFVHEVVHFL